MNRSFGTNTYSSTNSRMSALSTDWEELRKQARQLENDVDTKLISFSKLSSNYVARDQTSHHYGIDSSSTPTSSSFDAMSIEIEKLLERLSDINKRMAEAIPALPGSNTAATHTLQRHHEISQDYRREFERTKANIQNFKTREDLLINHNSDVNSPSLSSRRQDLYLREAGYITNSNKLLDEHLEKAETLKVALNNQRRVFMSSMNKLKHMANRFPLMNNIMQKIKIKKRKDSLVLGFVIALCLIFLLIYMFR
jgi:Golgi SNAP receptor complex protein 1